VLTLAAGDQAVHGAIMRTPHQNAGNSHMAAASGSSDVSPHETVHLVNVERLDSIFPPGALRAVRLLKIDTEGFECEVVRGAHRLMMSRVFGRITAERNAAMLHLAGCNGTALEATLVAAGSYAVSLRPTMTEATFIAQRSDGPQIVCRGHTGCGNAPLTYVRGSGYRGARSADVPFAPAPPLTAAAA